MRHDIRLRGHRYDLRPVVRDDAAFIVELRTDPELSAYLHPTSPDVADQEAWLEAYFQRPGDYYFTVDDRVTGLPVGVVAVYDSDGRSAEWGRWLIRRTAPAAVESALLVYRAAFEALGLDELYCRTVAGNESVVSFHDSSGAARSRLLPAWFELGGVRHDAVEHRVDRSLWQRMRPRLERLAQRVAEGV
jgi:RimJ/RimL family protein N-acetyltransferase